MKNKKLYLSDIRKLKSLAIELELNNCELLEKYNIRELANIYNGIGAEAFPKWLRDAISKLNPSLNVVALIHDIQWHESCGKKEGFELSNQDFFTNSKIVAKVNYKWFNPLRYIVIYKGWQFSKLCSNSIAFEFYKGE